MNLPIHITDGHALSPIQRSHIESIVNAYPGELAIERQYMLASTYLFYQPLGCATPLGMVRVTWKRLPRELLPIEYSCNTGGGYDLFAEHAPLRLQPQLLPACEVGGLRLKKANPRDYYMALCTLMSNCETLINERKFKTVWVSCVNNERLVKLYRRFNFCPISQIGYGDHRYLLIYRFVKRNANETKPFRVEN